MWKYDDSFPRSAISCTVYTTLPTAPCSKRFTTTRPRTRACPNVCSSATFGCYKPRENVRQTEPRENERTNELRDGWMVCGMDGWMNEWMNEWVNGWMDGWMNEWMNTWINEWIEEWMTKWQPRSQGLNVWILDDWMGKWVNKWKNEWIRGRSVSSGFYWVYTCMWWMHSCFG